MNTLRPLLLAFSIIFVIGLAIPAVTIPKNVSAVGSGTGLYFGTYGGSESTSSMSRISSVGVKAVRMYVEWDQLEGQESAHQSTSIAGSTKLSQYDRRIADLRDAGLTPIIFIGSAPSWAASRPRGPLFTNKLNSYVEFVSNLVRR